MTPWLTQIFPCSLSELLRINDKLVDSFQLDKERVCAACLEPGPTLLRCAGCNASWYCNKVGFFRIGVYEERSPLIQLQDCQKLDWTLKGHKKDCKLLKQLTPLLTKNWSHFERYYTFPL
jgi:hypothetical protein